ncbi:MAG TPA: rhomboid family intramembrane serine protease [Abditibacterium sp.]|jgi:membrane associated rhomboid family serine protease
MFPLKTLPNAKTAPHLTRLLIVLCVLAFGAQWVFQVARGLDAASLYGVVPRCFVVPSGCGVVSLETAQPLWVSLFASLFLHGDILHLAFNMLFLSAFGGGLEDKIGKWRFALVYFGGGLVASVAHIVFHPFSSAPTIGASGAIAAVLGAYLIMLPKSWVLTYFPPIFFLPVPAPLFLIVWIVGQISGALGDLHWFSASSGTNIAWMAHLGGFLGGALWGWKWSPWLKRRAVRV